MTALETKNYQKCSKIASVNQKRRKGKLF